METIDGQTLEIAIPAAEELADFFNIWTFYADGRYERRWGWTLGPNVVAPPVYFSADSVSEGLYEVDGDRLMLRVTKSTFFSDVPEHDAGTWVRDGLTLTLTFDGGTVIVLKAKV